MQKTNLSDSPELLNVSSVDSYEESKKSRVFEDSKKSMLEDIEEEAQFGSFPSSISAMFRGFSTVTRRQTLQHHSTAELSNAATNQLLAFNASDSYLRTPFRSFHTLTTDSFISCACLINMGTQKCIAVGCANGDVILTELMRSCTLGAIAHRLISESSDGPKQNIIVQEKYSGNTIDGSDSTNKFVKTKRITAISSFVVNEEIFLLTGGDSATIMLWKLPKSFPTTSNIVECKTELLHTEYSIRAISVCVKDNRAYAVTRSDSPYLEFFEVTNINTSSSIHFQKLVMKTEDGVHVIEQRAQDQNIACVHMSAAPNKDKYGKYRSIATWSVVTGSKDKVVRLQIGKLFPLSEAAVTGPNESFAESQMLTHHRSNSKVYIDDSSAHNKHSSTTVHGICSKPSDHADEIKAIARLDSLIVTADFSANIVFWSEDAVNVKDNLLIPLRKIFSGKYAFLTSINTLSICHSPFGMKPILVVGGNNGIQLLDLFGSKEVLRELPSRSHGDVTGTMVVDTEHDFNSSFTLITTQYQDKGITIWNFGTNEVIRTMKMSTEKIGHSNKIRSLVSLTIDGRTYLASSSRDKTVRIFHLKDALTQKARIDNNNNNFVSKGADKYHTIADASIVAVEAFSFPQESGVPLTGILLGSTEGNVSAWELRSSKDSTRQMDSKKINMIFPHSNAVNCIATIFCTSSFGGGMDHIVTGSSDRYIRICTLESVINSDHSPKYITLKGHGDEIRSLIVWVDPHDRHITHVISGGSHGEINVWTFFGIISEDYNRTKYSIHKGSIMLYVLRTKRDHSDSWCIASVGQDDGILKTWLPHQVDAKEKQNVFKLSNEEVQERCGSLVMQALDERQKVLYKWESSEIRHLSSKPSMISCIGQIFEFIVISFENGEVSLLDPVSKQVKTPHAFKRDYLSQLHTSNIRNDSFSINSLKDAGFSKNAFDHVGYLFGAKDVHKEPKSEFVTNFFDYHNHHRSAYIAGMSDGSLHMFSRELQIPYVITEGRSGSAIRIIPFSFSKQPESRYAIMLRNDGKVVGWDLQTNHNDVFSLPGMETVYKQYSNFVVGIDLAYRMHTGKEEATAHIEQEVFLIYYFKRGFAIFEIKEDEDDILTLLFVTEHVVSRDIVMCRLMVTDEKFFVSMLLFDSRLRLCTFEGNSWQRTAELPHFCSCFNILPHTSLLAVHNKSGVSPSLYRINPTSNLFVEVHTPNNGLFKYQNHLSKATVSSVKLVENRKGNQRKIEMISAKDDGTIIVWDFNNGVPRNEKKICSSPTQITSMDLFIQEHQHYSLNNHTIAVIGTSDNKIHFFSLKDGEIYRTIHRHESPITETVLCKVDGKDPFLFSAAEDSLVLVHDAYFATTVSLPTSRIVYEEYVRDMSLLRKQMKKSSGRNGCSFTGIEQLRKLAKSDAGFIFENNQLFAEAIYSNEDSGTAFLENYLYMDTSQALVNHKRRLDTDEEGNLIMSTTDAHLATHDCMPLLNFAVECENRKAVEIIVHALIREINQPLNEDEDFMLQVFPPGGSLPFHSLNVLARTHPVLFVTLIKGIKLQKVHPNLLRRESKVHHLFTGEIDFSSVVTARQLVDMWSSPLSSHPQNAGVTSLSLSRKASSPKLPHLTHRATGSLRIDLLSDATENKKEWAIPMYIPLPHAASDELIGLYNSTCVVLNDVSIYDSDAGKYGLKFAWKTFGKNVHMKTFSYHMVYLGLFTTALFAFPYWRKNRITPNNQISSANILFAYSMVGVCFWAAIYYLFVELWQLYKTDQMRIRKHFQDLWNVIDIVNHTTLLIGCFIRLIVHEDTNLSRCALAICCITMYFKILYFLRAFAVTGPLVAMIFTVASDMRAFLAVLGIVVCGFSMSFWIMTFSFSASPAYEQFGFFSSALLYSFNSMLGNFDSDFTGTASMQFWIVLFVLFQVVVALLLLNLLIALMGDSYVRVRQRGIAQWLKEQATIIHDEYCFITNIPRDEFGNSLLDPKFIHILKRSTDVDQLSVSNAPIDEVGQQGLNGAKNSQENSDGGGHLYSSDSSSKSSHFRPAAVQEIDYSKYPYVLQSESMEGYVNYPIDEGVDEINAVPNMGLTVEQLRDQLPSVDQSAYHFDDSEIKFVTSPEHSFKSIDHSNSSGKGYATTPGAQNQPGSVAPLSSPDLNSNDRGFPVGNRSKDEDPDASLRYILKSLVALPQFKDALTDIARSSAPTSRDGTN